MFFGCQLVECKSTHWSIILEPLAVGTTSVHWENHLAVIAGAQQQSTSHGNAMIPILQMRKLERFNDVQKTHNINFWESQEWSLNLVLSCYTALPPRLSGK